MNNYFYYYYTLFFFQNSRNFSLLLYIFLEFPQNINFILEIRYITKIDSRDEFEGKHRLCVHYFVSVSYSKIFL